MYYPLSTKKALGLRSQNASLFHTTPSRSQIRDGINVFIHEDTLRKRIVFVLIPTRNIFYVPEAEFIPSPKSVGPARHKGWLIHHLCSHHSPHNFQFSHPHPPSTPETTSFRPCSSSNSIHPSHPAADNINDSG